MSMGLNLVVLNGGLTADPDVRRGDRTSWLRFSVACSYPVRNGSGDWEERTDYVPCKAFGRDAENMGQYLKKGSRITVTGKVRTESYQSQDGGKRYDTYVLVDKVLFNGGGGRNTSSSEPPRNPPSSHEQSKSNGYQPQPRYDDDYPPYPGDGRETADIPF